MTAGNSVGDAAVAAPTVRLSARAEEAGTEIFITNTQFHLVEGGKGVGSVEVAVALGVYGIKFKAGDAVREVIKPVFGDTQVFCPPLAFASPAPLAGTSKTTLHPEHAGAARETSGRVHVTLRGKHKPVAGTMGQIFVFVRDLAPDQKELPCSGMTLCDLETGTVLVELHQTGEKNRAEASFSWQGCTIALKPGGYRLRVQTETAGRLEQVIVAGAGWQTQVFLLRRSYGSDASDLNHAGDVRADLCGGSVFMGRIGAGWSGSEHANRLTDLARQAIDTGRTRVVASGDLQAMLDGSLENPMLGIYASHLLLLSSSPNYDLVRKITDVLRAPSVLGETHPDIEALCLPLPGGTDAATPFTVPPMLRRSGDLLIAATATRPELVPEGSLAARAAPFLWGDGVWLVARNVPDAPPAPAPSFLFDRPSGLIRQVSPPAPISEDGDGGGAMGDMATGQVRWYSGSRGAGVVDTGEESGDVMAFLPGSVQDDLAQATGSVQDVLAQATRAAVSAVDRAKAEQAAKNEGASADADDDKEDTEQWNTRRGVRAVSRSHQLSPLESNLLDMLYGQAKKAPANAAAAVVPVETAAADLIRVLRVPYASLQSAAGELVRKLELSALPPRLND